MSAMPAGKVERMLKRISLLISALLCLGSVTLTSVADAEEKATPTPTPVGTKALNTGDNLDKAKLEQKNPLGTNRKVHGDPHVDEAPVPNKEPKVDAVKK